MPHDDKKKKRLKDLLVKEVSLVPKGANQGARIEMFKILDPEDVPPDPEVKLAELIAKLDDEVVEKWIKFLESGEGPPAIEPAKGDKGGSAMPKKIDLTKLSEEDRKQVEDAMARAERVDELETQATAHATDTILAGARELATADPTITADAAVDQVVTDNKDLAANEDAVKAAKTAFAKEHKSSKEDDVTKALRGTIDTQAETIKAQGERIDKMEKDNRRAELTKIAEGFPFVQKKTEEIVEALVKAETAGVLDDVVDSFKTANETAKASQDILRTIGSEHAGDATVGSVYEKIQKMAEELVTKSTDGLTREQAMTKVLKDNPELERQYADETRRVEQ